MTAPALDLSGAFRSTRPEGLAARFPSRTVAYLLALGVLVSAALAATDWLSFPLYRDEVQFLEDTRTFAADWPPGLEQLRNYPEPMTPLAFVIWGGVERAFGGGVVGLRLFNLGLCVAILCLIGLPGPRAGWRGPLSALGLLLCPYFLGLGVHLYTDVVAVFFAVLGLWLYARGHMWASACALVLAIATRQYMVVFPAALAAAAAYEALKGDRSRWLDAVLPYAASAATIAGWYAFFGGLSPPAGTAAWPRHADALGALHLQSGLYFLTSLGVYFVVPELLLFRRAALARFPSWRRCAWVGAAVAVAFALFPVSFGLLPGGAFSRAVRWAELGPIEPLIYASLAVLTAMRFARLDLATFLVALNFLVMLTAWTTWEKYHLPLIAALWLLSSREMFALPEPGRVHRARASSGARGSARAESGQPRLGWLTPA